MRQVREANLPVRVTLVALCVLASSAACSKGSPRSASRAFAKCPAAEDDKGIAMPSEGEDISPYVNGLAFDGIPDTRQEKGVYLTATPERHACHRHGGNGDANKAHVIATIEYTDPNSATTFSGFSGWPPGKQPAYVIEQGDAAGAYGVSRVFLLNGGKTVHFIDAGPHTVTVKPFASQAHDYSIARWGDPNHEFHGRGPDSLSDSTQDRVGDSLWYNCDPGCCPSSLW